MKICTNPGCYWKYEGKECPRCKNGSEISTQGASNKKRGSGYAGKSGSKRSGYIRPRKKNWKSVAKVMREYVQWRYPGTDGRNIPCDNCKGIIREIKYENVSHIKGRGAHPGEARDFENFEILCGPTDFWGTVDRSCHTLWEHGRVDEFKKNEDSRIGSELPSRNTSS